MRCPGYETCIVPATSLVDVLKQPDGGKAGRARRGCLGWRAGRVYIPSGAEATIACRSEASEIFIAGARFEEVLSPFAVRADNLDLVQYGSDETKTHRKIKHILGQKQAGQVGRLLASELFTVGAGGWSGFPPHKHDTDRLPDESRHDEVYNFRFRPEHGFGLQLLQPADGTLGKAFHLVNGSALRFRQAIIPVSPRRAMRCIISPFWAACRSGRWCSSSSLNTPGRLRPSPASRI